MKKHLILLCFSLPALVLGQFRGQEPRPPSLSEQVGPVSPSLLFGIIDPSRFSMSHTISMGYMSIGREGVGMSSYTNSIRYQVSDPLSVRADVAMMYSPFGSLSSKLNNSFSGIFLERAQIDYRPTKDFGISLQFRQLPPQAGPWYGGFGYTNRGYEFPYEDR